MVFTCVCGIYPLSGFSNEEFQPKRPKLERSSRAMSDEKRKPFQRQQNISQNVQRRSYSDTDTIEYRALRKSHSFFINTGDPGCIAPGLYIQNLLTKSEMEKSRQQSLTNREKLNELYTAVERRVCAEPEKFYKLLEVFEEEPAMSDIAERMKGTAYYFF